MFENLTEKLQRTFKNLRGQGKLTEEHLDAALAEIREALLEGDVNVGVADELLASIRQKAIGSEVMLQLSPDQQVVKTVRDELAQVAKAVGAQLWPGAGTDKPLEIVRGVIKEAKLSASDVILVDTAGRLHIDDELMNELSTLKKELQPAEILFIADAMIGQDAVRSAGEFHKRLGLTGVILTKLDGDARGGAALSIAKVSGAPVKFVGLGEKYD